MTKTATRAQGKRMMGDGQRKISSAEFRFEIAKEISREQFDAEVSEGTRLICDGADLVDCTYASNWQELAAIVGLA